MAQNTSFLDAIDREATQARANTHCHNSLPGKDVPLKTTQTFITTSCELYRTILKPFLRVEISSV